MLAETFEFMKNIHGAHLFSNTISVYIIKLRNEQIHITLSTHNYVSMLHKQSTYGILLLRFRKPRQPKEKKKKKGIVQNLTKYLKQGRLLTFF